MTKDCPTSGKHSVNHKMPPNVKSDYNEAKALVFSANITKSITNETPHMLFPVTVYSLHTLCLTTWPRNSGLYIELPP